MQTQDTPSRSTLSFAACTTSFRPRAAGKASLRLPESDVRCIVAEIEDGREACAALAVANRLLKRRLVDPVQADHRSTPRKRP